MIKIKGEKKGKDSVFVNEETVVTEKIKYNDVVDQLKVLADRIKKDKETEVALKAIKKEMDNLIK